MFRDPFFDAEVKRKATKCVLYCVEIRWNTGKLLLIRVDLKYAMKYN